MLKTHTNPRKLTDKQVKLLDDLCERNHHLAVTRRFMTEVFALFSPTQGKVNVLAGYHFLMKDRTFHRYPHLRRILQVLEWEKFKRAITYFDYRNCPRTTNHVERANRYYRKRAKSHYRNRTKRAIWNMIKSDLIQRKAAYNGRLPQRLERS